MKSKVLLGYTKKDLYGLVEPIRLSNFIWECNWYWAGGYVGNQNCHFHFNGAFLDVPDRRGHPLGRFVTPWDVKKDGQEVIDNGCSIWEDVTKFLDDVPEQIKTNWWRIKDLFKQFYTLQKAAEVFQYGGHCSSEGRTEAEINKEMAKTINLHILRVIIPEIHKACGFYDGNEEAERNEFVSRNEKVIEASFKC